MNEIEFKAFPKVYRVQRNTIITEKIDGTNAQVIVTDDGRVVAASRTRLITTSDDNFGFAKWVEEHTEELLKLGPGRHYGEWWGQGIQRGYGLSERRFSLFSVGRWKASLGFQEALKAYGKWAAKATEPPPCCHVVPVVGVLETLIDNDFIYSQMSAMRRVGSLAAPGFNHPEGIVLFHELSGALFKITLDGDGHKCGGKLSI